MKRQPAAAAPDLDHDPVEEALRLGTRARVGEGCAAQDSLGSAARHDLEPAREVLEDDGRAGRRRDGAPEGLRESVGVGAARKDEGETQRGERGSRRMEASTVGYERGTRTVPEEGP